MKQFSFPYHCLRILRGLQMAEQRVYCEWVIKSPPRGVAMKRHKVEKDIEHINQDGQFCFGFAGLILYCLMSLYRQNEVIEMNWMKCNWKNKTSTLFQLLIVYHINTYKIRCITLWTVLCPYGELISQFRLHFFLYHKLHLFGFLLIIQTRIFQTEFGQPQSSNHSIN